MGERIKSSLFFFLISCIYLRSSLTSAYVIRMNYDAALFGDYTDNPRSILYSRKNKPEDWKNLTKLASSQYMFDFTHVCTYGDGAWIAYPSEDWKIKDNSHFTFINGESCITTENINSMQPLGKIESPLTSGLIIFPEVNFQGKHVLLVNGSRSGAVGSMIFAGGKPYTITAGSDSICLMPTHPAQDVDLCLIPTLESSFGFKSEVSSIKEGCDAGGKNKVFSPQNCRSPGVHELYVSTDFSLKAMTGICLRGAVDNKIKSKFTQIMEIWKGRISHNLEGMESVKLPYEATFKKRMIDVLISVFHNSCPIVPPEYLSILKNVFLIHLRSAWEKYPHLVGVEDSYWKHTYMFMNSCEESKQLVPRAGNDDSDCNPDVGNGVDPEDEAEDALSDLEEGYKYDAVIEQMWLVLNLVTPLCNNINNYKTNDWMNMVSMFRRHFFDPLSNQWKNPGTWKTIYTHMFHGFDVMQQHSRIMSCVQRTLEMTPHFDPIGRTRSFLRMDQIKYEANNLYINELTNKLGGGAREVVKSDDGGEEDDMSKKPAGGEKPTKKPPVNGGKRKRNSATAAKIIKKP